MATVVPYINFEGASRAAVAFYEDVFGATAEVQEYEGRVAHFDFAAGDLHFMGGDHGPDERGVGRARESALAVQCDSEGQLRDLFESLVEGGEEVFSPSDSGWGSTIAHCLDRFGVSWMLNYDHT